MSCRNSSPQPPADRLGSLVAGYAQALLADLTRVGEDPRTEVVSRAGGGWTVLALALPTPPGERPADLTDCNRDCLKLLAGADKPPVGCKSPPGDEETRGALGRGHSQALPRPDEEDEYTL
jgi:hypothetical protein